MKMKPACERCGKHLAEDADAWICSHECTFCPACSAEMSRKCPNCSGELVTRPKRGKLPEAGSGAGFRVEHVFEPRATKLLGLSTVRGYRLRTYSIACDGHGAGAESFQEGIALLGGDLPMPVMDRGRAGVGFLILHAGRGMDYAVLGWWDRENELPIRIAVREHSAGIWRAARHGESVCVWDLDVIHHERNAYIHYVLKSSPEVEKYLSEGWIAGGSTRG